LLIFHETSLSNEREELSKVKWFRKCEFCAVLYFRKFVGQKATASLAFYLVSQVEGKAIQAQKRLLRYEETFVFAEGIR